MEELDWENWVTKHKYKVRKNQFPFYKQILDFLLSPNKDIIVNQGGMGLGKTFATGTAIKEIGGYHFISTPTGAIKNEWAKEFQRLGLFENGVVWLAKGDVCIKKKQDKYFNLDNCDDDCKYRHYLNANNEFTNLCKIRMENLKLIYPLNINDYYETFPNECLHPITRYGLKEEKIIIGDYFGFLNNKMYDKLVGAPTLNSTLIIDEAHLIPTRTYEYLSKSLALGQTIKKLREEISADYIINQFFLYTQLSSGIDIIEKIYLNLLNVIKNSPENIEEGRYNYLNFINDYLLFKRPQDLSFPLLITQFREVGKELYGDRKYEQNEDPYLLKFLRFFDNWKFKYEDEKYSQQFQYFKYKKRLNKEEILLKVTCRDTSEFLADRFKTWSKVVLISGTIPDQQYFFDMLGLKNFNIEWKNPLSSFSIKDNVVIYAKDNFISTVRINTYNKIAQNLNEILKILDGKTIIYIQSMRDAILLESLITSKEVINFCKYEDEDNGGELESVDKNKFEELKKLFLSKKEVVAIMGINGRVEGQNFLDEYNKTVDNIIIYGYPFSRQDLTFKDSLEYWTKKTGDAKRAREYVTYRPVSSKLFQAVMRAKRKEEDKPIILLWGDTFSKGSPGYIYAYDELKGEIIFEFDNLKKVLKERNEKRWMN